MKRRLCLWAVCKVLEAVIIPFHMKPCFLFWSLNGQFPCLVLTPNGKAVNEIDNSCFSLGHWRPSLSTGSAGCQREVEGWVRRSVGARGRGNGVFAPGAPPALVPRGRNHVSRATGASRGLSDCVRDLWTLLTSPPGRVSGEAVALPYPFLFFSRQSSPSCSMAAQFFHLLQKALQIFFFFKGCR